MDWQALLTSDAALLLYVTLVVFVYRKLQISQKWDTERWEGIIATAFTLAEKSGAISSSKLRFALATFNDKFKDTYGREPNAKELQDAALDFGRMAFELKFAPKPSEGDARGTSGT
jgi:hypothetical protein